MDLEKQLEEREQKKKYLKSYRESVYREQDIIEEIEELRMEKMQPSVKMSDGMPKAAGAHSDLSDYIVRLDAMMSRLIREKAEKIKKREEIEKRIDLMEDETEKRLLRLRYISGLEWDEVCDRLGYSWTHVHRIHSRALDDFKME